MPHSSPTQGARRWREKVVWDSLEGCEELALTIQGPKGRCLQEYLATANKEEVVSFFRGIINHLRYERMIEDYHLVLRNRKGSGWKVVVYHGGTARKDFDGPLNAERCMSCDLGTSMQTGLRGSGDGGLEARDTLIYEDDLMRYWHDAKGRPMFVVTPQRHVRRMTDLTDDELYQLWGGAVQVCHDMGLRLEDFKDAIVNEGKDQSHEHLHLKIRLYGDSFNDAMEKWPKKRRKVVESLRAYARGLWEEEESDTSS